MTTLLLTQPDAEKHKTPDGHVECQDRLVAINQALTAPRFAPLLRETSLAADLSHANIVHDQTVLKHLQTARPSAGIRALDADTFISPGSLDAVASGLGAALRAIEAVALGEVDNAFCAIRPPGHHAEIVRSMGFCLVNTIAIAARLCQKLYGAERIAIIDFDVHHGNGTQDIFKDDPNVFYASSHEMPLYPGSGAASETGVGNIFNVPLAANSGGSEMKTAYELNIFPALANFAPDFIFLSAGFDAHARDPLANLQWSNQDFGWITGKIMDIADQKCGNRIVSLLEGGYDLTGLSGGVAEHVGMLMSGGSDRDAQEH